jgi:hypothetical protein
MSFAVGQTVVYAPNDKRASASDLTITAVGRKWVTLSNQLRFDRATLLIDDRPFSSPGRIYRSRDEYNTAVAIKDAWVGLVRALGYEPVAGVTLADLKAARKLLRV